MLGNDQRSGYFGQDEKDSQCSLNQAKKTLMVFPFSLKIKAGVSAYQWVRDENRVTDNKIWKEAERGWESK